MIRQSIIDEAMRWLKTPWHHRACVNGGGADCVFFLVGVYNAVGITHIVDSDIPYYPQDIMMHRSDETVLESVTKYAHEVDSPQMGDIAIWKFGHIYSHAAIVIEWPLIIHSYRLEGMVVLGDASKGKLVDRDVKFFSMVGL